MKKVWKGFAAAVSAAAIAATGFIGATSANAVVTETASVNFTNWQSGNVVTPYLILNIESENIEDGNTNYVYSVNAANKAAVIAGMNAIKAEGAADIAADVTDANLIKAVLDGLNSTNVEQFATAFMGASPTAGNTINKANADIQQGYYLFDLTTVGGSGTAAGSNQYTKSRYMVDTVGSAGASITIKNGSVTLVKKVKDNPTDPDTGSTNSGWNDSADYAIGDTVPFQLTGTLPEQYGEYDKYYYQFVDTMSAGLTYSGKDKVTIKSGSTDLTNCFGIASEGTGPTTLKFTAENLKTCVAAAGLKAGDSIVVEYEATLNDNAVIGTAGNPNTAKLVFSNDPKQQGEGDTAETPEDLVKVFTYDFQGTKEFKITPNDNDLPVFKLTNTSTNKVYDNLRVTKQADSTYKFDVKGIDAGVYKLEETYTPAGFNKAADVIFTLKAVHDAESTDPQVTITVTPTIENAASVTTTGAAATVVNTGGNKLPETGGMGTTVLYAAGAVIVLLAGIGLAVTLRRHQA